VPVVYEMRSFFEGTWSSNADAGEHAEYARRRWAAETRAMLAVDAVVTLSETMRREVIERGVAEDRAVVVANGVDVDFFAPRPRDAALADRLGLTGRAVFGYLGNLDHAREGQELLVEATARLRARGRSVACLIVGDGVRRGELEALAAKRGVADAVVFAGQVPHDEVPAYYAQFDVFVVPRRDDRAARFVTPLKPFEALASGLPLVVSDLPALVEVAAPDERGLRFPAGDVDGLVAALELVLDDTPLARRLGAAGRAWVTAERTWASNGLRYRDLYARIGVRLPGPEGPDAG
jgi:glycosyltransferase involved in cell wall biosynthesis